MKRIAIIVILFALCIGFTACNKQATSETNVVAPFRQVATLYDRHGNLLEQTIYNEETGEYIFKEYTYALDGSMWVCIDQKTTILSDQTKYPYIETVPKFMIYHNDDIAKKPIILIDNDKVKVSIVKSLSEDSWYKFAYELEVVNKTNKVLTVVIENAAIMDIGCPPLFNVDHFEANQKAYFTLGWDLETLERFYIPYIDNVEFTLKVYENEDLRTPAFVGERVMIKH